MKKFLSILLINSLLFSANSVCAQEKKDQKPGVTSIVTSLSPETPKTEKDVGAALSPMRKGQFSPFTGVLISPLAVATLIAELRAKDEETKIEVDRAKGELEANFVYEKRVLENQCAADKKIVLADVQSKKEQISSLDSALRTELETRPNPAFWMILGIATGVVATAATATAVFAATN
jgi:hypothetical protein